MLLNDQIRHIDYFLLTQSYNWLCGIPVSSMHCRTGSQNAPWEMIWVTRRNLILRSLIQFFCQTWENNYKIQKIHFALSNTSDKYVTCIRLTCLKIWILKRTGFFLHIIIHSFCLSTARNKWSIYACFSWVGTESHRRHSHRARVIKCDSTVHIIRLPLPALAGKATCCFSIQLELSVMLLSKEGPTAT